MVFLICTSKNPTTLSSWNVLLLEQCSVLHGLEIVSVDFYFLFLLAQISQNSLLSIKELKVTSATKHKNTAKEIIIYTHRVYSLLLKFENNEV